MGASLMPVKVHDLTQRALPVEGDQAGDALVDDLAACNGAVPAFRGVLT